jgi:hypothetical protein
MRYGFAQVAQLRVDDVLMTFSPIGDGERIQLDVTWFGDDCEPKRAWTCIEEDEWREFVRATFKSLKWDGGYQV